MKTKLSFKKEPKETGLYSVAHPYQNVKIKIDKKYVGLIIAPDWQIRDVWIAGFAIKKEKPDDNPNCDWKWYYFSKKFTSEEDAREFVKEIIDDFVTKHTLHFFED